MAAPSPLDSLLGGLSLPLPVHSLALLNGDMFGISGFVHRAARGSTEALAAVSGLILGGVAAGFVEGGSTQPTILSLPQTVASGFLVGLGTKLSNGCTSGHMVCGIARLSMRSITATVTFFVTGAITAHIAHGGLGPTAPLNWSLGTKARQLLVAQIVPLAISLLLYFFSPSKHLQSRAKSEPDARTPIKGTSADPEPQPIFRHLASISTSAQFAIALQLSGLTSSTRVIRFLLLPFHEGFDPSLAFLATGTMPLAMFLYHFARGREVPLLGGKWTIPKRGEIDLKLVIGAAIFGIGWGLSGICPGPGLVNFGRFLVNNDNNQLIPTALWLVALATGGLIF